MEKKTPRSLLPFDELTMPGDLYLLKLLLPFIPAHMQKLLAIFIKYLGTFLYLAYVSGICPERIFPAVCLRTSSIHGSGQLRQIPPVGNDDADVFHVRK